MAETPLPHKALDIDLKAFFKVHKDLPFRLLGRQVNPAHIRAEDTSVVVRELQADRLFVHEPPGGPAEALMPEFFMDPPKLPQLLDCLIKPLQAMRNLQIKVIAVLIYLRKGAYATFPDGLTVEGFEGLQNHYQVERVLLWEHEAEIRTGALRALAPLLLLWEDNPEETGLALVREGIRTIDAAGFTDEQRRESLALLYVIGFRTFAASALRVNFGDKMIDVKQTETIKEWLDEARDEARVEALEEGLEKGREEGLVLGRIEGRVGKARDLLVQHGTLRFGKPRRKTLTALDRIPDEARLDSLAARLLEVETWDELLALQ